MSRIGRYRAFAAISRLVHYVIFVPAMVQDVAWQRGLGGKTSFCMALGIPKPFRPLVLEYITERLFHCCTVLTVCMWERLESKKSQLNYPLHPWLPSAGG